MNIAIQRSYKVKTITILQNEETGTDRLSNLLRSQSYSDKAADDFQPRQLEFWLKEFRLWRQDYWSYNIFEEN